MEQRLREKQYASRTVETYGQWVERFERYCEPLGADLGVVSGREVRQFLDMLARDEKVRVATQHQALNALVRFFAEVLERPVNGLEGYLRARSTDRVPVVLGQQETADLLNHLEGVELLMGQLMYGGGLRLMELLRLRVKDADVERRQLVVRGGKGDKDRLTTLPERSVAGLKAHVAWLRTVWQEDVANELPGVYLPEALGRKYPNAGASFPWQWLFPTKDWWLTPRAGCGGGITCMSGRGRLPLKMQRCGQVSIRG